MYWELNIDFDPSELAGVAQTLIKKNCGRWKVLKKSHGMLALLIIGV